MQEISRGKIFGSPFRKWTINADRSLDGNAVKINPIDAEISFLGEVQNSRVYVIAYNARHLEYGKEGKEDGEKADEGGGRGEGTKVERQNSHW